MRVQADDLIFDDERRELTRGGVEIHLSPKAFLLLGELIRASPSALSKEELYQRLWGDRFVEDSNIPNLISEIRSALADESRSDQYLKTIHGFGYRFVPESRVLGHDPSGYFILWHSQKYPLRYGKNVLGRDPEAGIVLDGGGVSRRHATVTVDRDGVWIEDLGSKNGTFVGGKRVETKEPLSSEDVVQLGSTTLIFRRASADDSTLTETHS